MNHLEFQRLIKQMGEELYRDMPWRTDTRPYYVLVSELMLQQTQVSRVIPKFEAFIAEFPDVTTLADANFSDVLTQWQGLGYNRRAKFLHGAAKKIAADLNGVFPVSDRDLLSLPGVGANTAGAIAAYAFNRPSIFIETNVRTVYIQHFFTDHDAVSDDEITQLLVETIDYEHPREFYWALMDYGSWLKASGVRNVTRSRHYKKQSPLEGSVRQVRGMIIYHLTNVGRVSEQTLRQTMPADDRYEVALKGLITDGMVMQSNGDIRLTK